ncbi:MAG: GNAT family N-acetyltransferase [Actinomycetota bacterium]
MADVREIGIDESRVAFGAMRELRTDLESEAEFVRRVDEVQRAEGYRLVGSFEEGEADAAAVAGFRFGHSLAWGHFLYVDDLITREAYRSHGHAGALMDWLVDEAGRLGCDQLHLDSGSQRHDAHRFYLAHGLLIPGFHFARGAQPDTTRDLLSAWRPRRTDA